MNEHLLWDLMSAYSDTLTRRSKHLASPMLLTSSGPLTSRHSWPRDHLSIPGIRPIRSLRVSRGLCAPGLLIIRSTRSNWVLRGSYPEGNFGGNQLLDHSISLSPLCAYLDIDLHVRTSSALQRPFGRLQLRTRKGRGLSGPSEVALTHIFQKSESSRVVDGASRSASTRPSHLRRPTPPFTFVTRPGFLHPNTRNRASLLGPCSKTGVLNPFCQHLEQDMVILHRVQDVKPRAPACCPRSPGPRRHRSPAQIKGRLLSALLRPPSAGSGSGVGGLGCLRINRASRAQPAPPPPGLFPAHAPMDVDLPKSDRSAAAAPPTARTTTEHYPNPSPHKGGPRRSTSATQRARHGASA